jgi:hypothetical protein
MVTHLWGIRAGIGTSDRINLLSLVVPSIFLRPFENLSCNFLLRVISRPFRAFLLKVCFRAHRIKKMYAAHRFAKAKGLWGRRKTSSVRGAFRGLRNIALIEDPAPARFFLPC